MGDCGELMLPRRVLGCVCGQWRGGQLAAVGNRRTFASKAQPAASRGQPEFNAFAGSSPFKRAAEEDKRRREHLAKQAPPDTGLSPAEEVLVGFEAMRPQLVPGRKTFSYLSQNGFKQTDIEESGDTVQVSKKISDTEKLVLKFWRGEMRRAEEEDSKKSDQPPGSDDCLVVELHRTVPNGKTYYLGYECLVSDRKLSVQRLTIHTPPASTTPTAASTTTAAAAAASSTAPLSPAAASSLEVRDAAMGVELDSLDEDLQAALLKYLDELGVDHSTAEFVQDYLEQKDRNDFSNWANLLQTFFRAEPPSSS